jgi:tetratricopeptide (TPR) repeat protein
MGSKLAILAIQLIATGTAGLALAQPAPELVKKGLDAYKAGKYHDAARLLEQAYEQDRKPETLFALAQAERLAGQCDKAVPRYKKLIEQTTDIAAAKAVQNNLALCPEPEPVKPIEEPALADAPPVLEPAPAPPPQTIVREVPHQDGLGIALVGGGALGAGLSIGLLMRSSATRDDATTARTLDDANRLHDRADRDRIVGVLAGSVSVLALGYGIYRLVSGESAQTEVALTPTSGGSLFVLSRTW